MKPLKQFKKLARKTIEIRDNQELTWEEKYDLIFSEKVVAKISLTGIKVEWYDPDTTHEEDVRAYVDAVEYRLNQCS